MNPANKKTLTGCAERVTLVVGVDPVAKELYGTTEPTLDEKSTLRRVVLFYRGTGAYVLTPEERDVALDVIRARFAQKYEAP